MATSYELGGAAPETKSDDDSEESSKTKKKSSFTPTKRLAGIATETSLNKVDSKQSEAGRQENNLESLLKKLGLGGAESEKPKEKQVPIFGVELPDGPTLAGKSETNKDTANDTNATQPEAVAEPDAEKLSDEAELKQQVREMIEVGKEDSLAQMHEIPLEEVDSPEAAEAAAAYVFYSKMEDDLKSGAVELAEVPENAAQVVAEQLEAEPDESAEQPELTPTTPNAEQLDDNEEEDEQAAAAQNSGSGAGSGGNGGNGGGPGSTGNPNQPPTPPFGPNSPYGAQSNQPPYGGASSFNAAPSMPNVAPKVIVGDERAAFGAGMLVGGVVGYFFGRHRGRKQGAKTAESKSRPIRKGLERQVLNLQETITAKEIQLKGVAREKMQALQGRKDREQYVGRILQSSAPEAALTAKVVTESNSGRAEIPLAVAGAAIAPAFAGRAAVERFTSETRSSNAPRAEVVPFNKDVKEFTKQELMATAEKVKVQGTSLKEMAELGQLDEPGLRRVVGEFLKGGDVTKAVSQEIKEKELQYEQDPVLRHFKAGQGGQASSQAMGAGGLVVGSMLDQPVRDQTAAKPGASGAGFDGKRPEPDAATLKAVRNKQAAALSATIVFVILAIIFAFVAT